MTKTDKNINRLFKKAFRGTITRFVNLTPQAIKKLVPKGCYCYDENGNCPFWEKFEEIYPEQMNGYCSLLQRGDWMQGEDSVGEMWDQCKNCGINDDDESLYEPEKKK